jgi:hypothetical protein
MKAEKRLFMKMLQVDLFQTRHNSKLILHLHATWFRLSSSTVHAKYCILQTVTFIEEERQFFLQKIHFYAR